MSISRAGYRSTFWKRTYWRLRLVLNLFHTNILKGYGGSQQNCAKPQHWNLTYNKCTNYKQEDRANNRSQDFKWFIQGKEMLSVRQIHCSRFSFFLFLYLHIILLGDKTLLKLWKMTFIWLCSELTWILTVFWIN